MTFQYDAATTLARIKAGLSKHGENQLSGCTPAKAANPANVGLAAPKSLAALATLAGGHPEKCIFGNAVGSENNASSPAENQKPEGTPAKVAKAANLFPEPSQAISAQSGPSSPVPGVRWPTSAADWSTYYADRVLVAEITAGLSRLQAEARAYKACLGEWLDRNPVSSKADDGCAVCSATDRPGDDLLPIGLGTGLARTWLHRDCIPTWRSARMDAAAEALRVMGITSKGSPPLPPAAT